VPILQTTGGRVFISPVAKKLAAQMGIDYRQISGTGPNGRIVKADVLGYKPSAAAIRAQDEPGTVIPYAGIRRAVGETMQRAWTTIPMVTHQVSAGASALLEYRAMLNAGADKHERVSIGELMLKLTAAALAAMPIMNSSLTDEGIVLHRHVHLGMATALDNGLVVPVIRGAERKGLLEISREAKDLAARARAGALSPDEISGSTFTVSNLGGYGSVDFFTPIINPPEAAILGIGRVTEASVPTIGLSLTYDHRIIDGAAAAKFAKTLMTLIDNPLRALL
jgi:pyruvate dehydrogenase E2 component (dihydrolipoamide acetyltransferase)